MTVFIRVLDASVEDKPAVLLQAIARTREASKLESVARVFVQAPETFVSVPGSPFAYWVSERMRSSFTKHPRLQSDVRRAVFGGSTKDDQRYLRLWFEVGNHNVGQTRAESRQRRWSLFAKGGAFAPFFADVHLVVNWFRDGTEVKADIAEYRGSRGWGYHWTAALNGHDDYFRRGLTWPRRTTSGLGVRAMPAGCIFADKGPAVFVNGDSTEGLLALLAVLNSEVFAYLVAVQLAAADAAARSYEVGLIQQTPVPELDDANRDALAVLSRRVWSLKRSLDTTNETSHAFVLPARLNAAIDGAAVEHELEEIQAQIDDLTFRLYGISAEDRAEIEASTNPATSHSDGEAEATDDTDEADDSTAAGGGSDALLSYFVGVAFGRFDPRLATGERAIPLEPEPFDPLPSRSPGMYPDGEEPADRIDILVDDEGHADDLTARAQAVALGRELGNVDASERVRVDVPENLRGWLAKEFFPLHIRMYSKSRRKAPIYWQLATPSASYSVWLYIHAFNKDTLFRVQNDYIGGERGKLAHEERRLESLASELRDGATAAQRKQLSEQEALVEELRAFLDEVKRVAPLWNPNLDDGVIINFAPLWRLVPQNKAWQKELKCTWEALCEGKYDWAHLAMHLWPERVVPKCAKDRSLAIAHRVEDVFWVEGDDGKWTARKTPTKSVDDLVKERTSPAVKSALKSLLEAPAASGKSTGRGRGAGRRKGAAAVEGDA